MCVCVRDCLHVCASVCAHVCIICVSKAGLRACVCVAVVCVPPDGHCEGLGGAGAGTDDVGSQPFSLKDVEEGVAGGDGP